MATYEQIMTALRNADAAGDTEAAKRLAEMAKAAKAESYVNTGPTRQVISAEERAANVAANASRQAAIDKPVEQDIRDPGALSAFASGASQGLSFGFGDEIGAGMAAVNPFDGMGYDQALKAIRGQNENAAFARPKTELSGQVVGGLIPALTGGGVALGAGKTVAGKMGLGAATGALEGGAYGFGTGEDGAANRSINAAKIGAIGAVAGSAAPVVMAGVRAGANLVANPIKSALNIGGNTQASSFVKKLMERAKMTPDDLQAAIRSATNDGQPEFAVADALGVSGQRGLSGITRQPGEARAVVSDFLMNRQGGQGNRLSGFVSDALTAPDTAAARRATMTAARKDAANVAYDAARTGANPVDVRGALGVIDNRIGGMQGSSIAGDGIDAKLSRFRSRLAAPTASLPQGTTARELSDFDRVLGVKQEVQDAIGEAVRAGRNNEARELGKLQSELDAALETSSSAYRGANDDFARASRSIDAIDEGTAATSGRVRSQDSTARYAGMTPEQQTAFRAGYADPTIARIDNAAPGVNKARPLMNDKATAELGAMAQDPALLGRQIGRENTMFETGAQALGGSKTADNMADNADAIGSSASIVMNALTGRWGTAATQVADRFASAAAGQNPKTREIIARMLISQDPQAALVPAIRKAARINKNDAVIGAIVRSGAARIGGGMLPQ